MSTHVNAYKMELEKSLSDAEAALGEVRVKYQAFLSKLEEHTGAVEQIDPGVTPVSTTPKVVDKPVDKVVSVEPKDSEPVVSKLSDKPVLESKDSTKVKVEGQK